MITSVHAAGGAETKTAEADGTSGSAIKATSPTGDAVVVTERSAPKIVGIVPSGWKIVPLDGATIESDQIEFRPGLSSVITLSPYKLVPDPKQAPYAFKEAGFDPSLGNRQTDTIAAILGHYNDEEQKLDDKLGSVIDRLRTALNQGEKDQDKSVLNTTRRTGKSSDPTAANSNETAQQRPQVQRPQKGQ